MAIIKHKSQRVGIFIDTQNLYHSAKNLYKAKVNFGNVVKEALAGRVLIRAYSINIRTCSWSSCAASSNRVAIASFSIAAVTIKG